MLTDVVSFLRIATDDTEGMSPLRFPPTVIRQVAVTAVLSLLVAVIFTEPGFFGMIVAVFPDADTATMDVSLLLQSTRYSGSEMTVPSSRRLNTSAVMVLFSKGGSMAIEFSLRVTLRTLSAFVTAFFTFT